MSMTVDGMTVDGMTVDGQEAVQMLLKPWYVSHSGMF